MIIEEGRLFLESYLVRQLDIFGGSSVGAYLDTSLKQTEYCFSRYVNKYYRTVSGDVRFSV